MPWESGLAFKANSSPGEASQGPLQVLLAQDGTIHINDDKGVILLRTGLPGRPFKAWRDAGIPLPSPTGTFSFPDQTPMQEGLGNFPLDKLDFRPTFKGLLWLLSDEASILTVLHPATLRVIHLQLPGACRDELHFLEDRLAFKTPNGTAWTLSYAALLPQWISLGRSNPKPKAGNALQPFPE